MDPRPAEQRQRWRLVVAREEAARDLIHRDVIAAWEAALRASGLPLSMSEGATPRPRITFAAQAPLGVLGERELIDFVVTQLMLIHEVRSAVEAVAPAGYRLVDLFDVWLTSPSLAALVTAGDYSATVAIDAGGPMSTAEIAAAVEDLLAAPRIEIVRTKGQGDVTVDIRPLIHALQVGPAAAAAAAPPKAAGAFELKMRLRLGGEGGIGRPEEIVAALGETLGRRLAPQQITRERIVLADDPDA